MLLFKRLLTTLGLFVVLFFVIFAGTMVVGGALSGLQAGNRAAERPRTYEDGYAIGQRAGEEFAVRWVVPIRNLSLAVALAGAAALSFSGALPWCRRQPTPPPLPLVLP